jgi:predicted AlkP superfamily pyrophosphatase or phosphodiesterase
MKLRLTPVFCLVLVASLAHGQTTRPVPQVGRVMVVSIDGLRPDVLLRANAPNLHKLTESGAFTYWAQTVPIAVTLPAHTSMLTGVSVERHRINFNDDRATTRPFYPTAPTLFEVARQAGYSTALVSGKAKFMALNKPGTIDWFSAPESAKTTDADVADAAGTILRLHKPQVMFVHFPGGDTTGHASGWASKEQFAAVEKVDEYVGMLMHGLQTSGLADSTIVIVSADHGGSGKKHGANDPRSLYIPWIASGPGIRRNFDLTSLRELTIRTEDTFATACFVLGIPLPAGTQGRPVVQIMEDARLLRDAQSATP